MGHILNLCMIPWQVRLFLLNFFSLICNPVNLEFSKQKLSIDLVCGIALGYLWTYFEPVSIYWAPTMRSRKLMRLWICSALGMTRRTWVLYGSSCLFGSSLFLFFLTLLLTYIIPHFLLSIPISFISLHFHLLSPSSLTL